MIRYKTKPLELPKAIEEIWEILEDQDEIIQILLKRIVLLEDKLSNWEASDEVPTKRLQ